MTHARRGHDCPLCGKRVFGNGGKVAHARGHVRKGELVELVKWYSTLPSPSRLFIDPADTERIARNVELGFELLRSDARDE
jgi:hypothetical protein